jgi:hypothetical protein
LVSKILSYLAASWHLIANTSSDLNSTTEVEPVSTLKGTESKNSTPTEEDVKQSSEDGQNIIKE